MVALSRAAFLQATGAVASAIGFLYPGLPNVVPLSLARQRTVAAVGEDTPDVVSVPTNFAQGQVVSVRTYGVVVQAGGVWRALRVPPAAKLWKEYDVSFDAVQMGDWLDAKGTPLVDGTFQVDEGWLNIARRDGWIVGQRAMPGSGLAHLVVNEVRRDNGRFFRDSNAVEWELSERLEVVNPRDGSVLAEGVGSLVVGSQVSAVGIYGTASGFRATRVWMT